MLLATTLSHLPNVLALHEGHLPGDPPVARLPLVNLENRKAWHEPAFADQTVASKRDSATLCRAAGGAELLIDVAFYNSPLILPLMTQYPGGTFLVIFRRCESFVRSATITTGEDRQPAGWPDPSKPLTSREQFISLGRLKPPPGSADAEKWDRWSAVQRNIWLWHSVNSHLHKVVRSHPNCRQLMFEDLVEDPEKYWTQCLLACDRFTPDNLARCRSASRTKINQRPSYQIGSIASWNHQERSMYDRLARPLEEQIYG
jgi:hypothetical protein